MIDALVPLEKSCNAGEMYGCQFQAYAVVRAGHHANEVVRYKAASFFAGRCGETPKHLEACYNLAVMYYNGSVKGGREKAREVAKDACSAGSRDACPMVTEIDAQRAHATRMAEADARRAEAYSARQQGGYRAGVSASYSNSSSGSSSNYSSGSSNTSRAQDSADFNAFINKVNSYGTGYSASCRTGNPYC